MQTISKKGKTSRKEERNEIKRRKTRRDENRRIRINILIKLGIKSNTKILMIFVCSFFALHSRDFYFYCFLNP